MNIKRFISALLITLVFVSCKSAKTLSSGTAEFNLSAKQLIKANKNTKAKFNTLQSRVKVEYTKAGKSQTHTITFRVLKDQIIWINSALSIMRIKITPEKVSFYNKLDNTYFDGDFSLLSDFLGTELDFDKVQNLVLGEALYTLQKDAYDVSVHQKSYLLQPKIQPEAFEIFYLLNPSHFKIDSQQLAQPVNSRLLQIDYLSYQDVDKEILPQHIKINALEANEETTIELNFKSIALNEDLRFPFKIPSGYDKIILN